MSFRDHILILKPREETYTAPLDIVQKVLSESKLSKSEKDKLIAFLNDFKSNTSHDKSASSDKTSSRATSKRSSGISAK